MLVIKKDSSLRHASSSVGSVPVTFVFVMSIDRSDSQFANELGRLPFTCVLEASRYVSLDHAPYVAGSGPDSRAFFLTLNSVMFTIRSNSGGSVPDSLFPSRYTCVSIDAFPNSAGSVPIRLLLLSERLWQLERPSQSQTDEAGAIQFCFFIHVGPVVCSKSVFNASHTVVVLHQQLANAPLGHNNKMVIKGSANHM